MCEKAGYITIPHRILSINMYKRLHMHLPLRSRQDKNPYSTDFFARTIKLFYDAVIEDAAPWELGVRVREAVNELVKNRTHGRVTNFLGLDEQLFLTPPLTAVATSFLHVSTELLRE